MNEQFDNYSFLIKQAPATLYKDRLVFVVNGSTFGQGFTYPFKPAGFYYSNGKSWIYKGATSTSGSGTVTSVDISSNGAVFTITGNPITTAGTIAIDFNGASTDFIKGDGSLDSTTYYPFPTGTTSQYIRGDGTLATLPTSSGTVTNVATAGLISGGPITTTGTITTSMATNRLVGRGTAGIGVMEEITLGTGLSLTGTTLNATSTTTLAIGTTPITSGTVGRILFEGTGNVLQQSANLFWNNTDARLVLSAVASPTGRLSILSPATTGLAIQVRNNADTGTQFSVDGNGMATFSNIANSNSLFILNGGSAGSGYLIGSNSAVSGTNKFLVISPGSIQMLDSLTGGRTLFPFSGISTGNFSIGNASNRGVFTHSGWASGFQIELENGNIALQDSNARRPTSLARNVLLGTVGVLGNAVTDSAILGALDTTGTAGKAWWHARGEHTGNTDNIIINGTVYKTTTGDPSYNHESLMCINTFDNNLKMYADGAWRTIITW